MKKNRFSVWHKELTDSTNEDAKRAFLENGLENGVFVADAQTAGKGRRGRSFYSPIDGIYMSVLFQSELGPEKVVKVTTAVSVLVAEVIERVTGKSVGIKWVNDLYYRNYKVCGILTEVIPNSDPNGHPAYIVGIGINLAGTGFPDELKNIAGVLYEESVTPEIKQEIIKGIVAGFENLLEHLEHYDYISAYRARSIVLGQEITCYEGNCVRNAKAVDIDDDGGLVIETEDGGCEVLRSGEITIRVKN